MIRLKDRHKKGAGIMISPMIDMSFLLLVFFVVSTMSMSEARTLPVQLPQASSVQLQQQSRFTVTMKEDGSLYLEGKPISQAALVAQAKARAQQDPQFSVVIYGDGRVPYKKIIGLLDGFKEAGVTRVGLAAEKTGAAQ